MTPLELQWCYYARSWTRRKGFLRRVGRSSADSCVRAQSGVRALGPCSATVREPTLRPWSPASRPPSATSPPSTSDAIVNAANSSPARRRRRRRRDPPGRRARPARRVPRARRLRHRRRQAPRPGSRSPPVGSSTPSARSGTAAIGRGRAAGVGLPPVPRGRRRDRRTIGGLPCDLHRDLRLPACARDRDRGRARCGRRLTNVELVRFVCFDDTTLAAYEARARNPRAR